MARGLAREVQNGEAERRSQAAAQLAEQAQQIITAARTRLDQAAHDQAVLRDELAIAERDQDLARLPGLRTRAATLATEWQDALASFKSVEGGTDFDALQAAVNAAGLALEIEIVDERRPNIETGSKLPTLITTGFVALLIILPLCGLVVGAFDAKVHEADDVRRLALPLVGHVPAFPGDTVAAPAWRRRPSCTILSTMAVTPTVTTARDRLDQLIRFGHRASRYWWLTAGVIIIGGVLSVLFAMSRPKMYQSGAVLYYQERLQTSLLQNRDTSTQHRNIGERYREILLARSSLVEIVRDPTINPLPDVVDSEGEEAAVEELRARRISR